MFDEDAKKFPRAAAFCAGVLDGKLLTTPYRPLAFDMLAWYRVGLESGKAEHEYLQTWFSRKEAEFQKSEQEKLAKHRKAWNLK